MTYKFATENKNYEDLSSGRVLYNQQGTTAFPVRLASEIFQRCKHKLTEGPYKIYDPCCGGGYLLSSIGFLHRKDLKAIYASDIEPGAVDLAQKNLSLLNLPGITQRTEQLQEMAQEYNKPSHQEAISSALELKKTIDSSLMVETFSHDITSKPPSIKDIDMVITDLPYGDLVHWREKDQEQAINRMFTNLKPIMATQGVIAVVSLKKTKINPDGYQRLVKFNLGKRQILIFSLGEG